MIVSGSPTPVDPNSDMLSLPLPPKSRPLEPVENGNEPRRETAQAGAGHRQFALGALRQELHFWMKAQFGARIPASLPAYAEQGQGNPDDVAKEALGAAQQLLAESPVTAAKSLISFRAKVHETASYVRESIGPQSADLDDIDQAIAKVDEGLDELETRAAGNRESTASVLAVDTRTRQRSTIQIRTQEGDVVRFSLKRVDAMSATDVAYADGNMSVTSTEVAVSSRSRMMMRVEGDLNESELAAIQNVFAQAEMIADEFFGGDIGAAFNVAQGFEFDTEQLARVKMRFRLHEVSNLTYAERTTRPEGPVAMPSKGTPPLDAPPVIEDPVGEVETAAAPVVPQVAEPASDEQVVASPVAEEPVPAVGSFLDSLNIFLRSVGAGFEGESGQSSLRLHYSQSLKLELLKAVFHTVASDDNVQAVDNASMLIDAVNTDDSDD